jgi:hypothetical protein
VRTDKGRKQLACPTALPFRQLVLRVTRQYYCHCITSSHFTQSHYTITSVQKMVSQGCSEEGCLLKVI